MREMAVAPLRSRVPWALGSCAASLVCFGGNAPDAGCPESGVRIYLDRHGKVTVNGKVVGLENLAGTLAAIEPALRWFAIHATTLNGNLPSGKRCNGGHHGVRLPIGFFTDKTYKTPAQ